MNIEILNKLIKKIDEMNNKYQIINKIVLKEWLI